MDLIGVTLLYSQNGREARKFKKIRYWLTKTVDVGKPIGQENHVICPHNYFTSIFWLPETVLSLSLSLSYILTSRDSLALPASDTKLNTFNMRAYIVCDLFLSWSVFSAGLVPVLRTSSVISSSPERDKRPTWKKTCLPKIHF